MVEERKTIASWKPSNAFEKNGDIKSITIDGQVYEADIPESYVSLMDRDDWMYDRLETTKAEPIDPATPNRHDDIARRPGEIRQVADREIHYRPLGEWKPEPLPDPHEVGFDELDICVWKNTDDKKLLGLAYDKSTPDKQALLNAFKTYHPLWRTDIP